MKHSKALGLAIAQERKAAGMTQAILGLRLNCHASMIAKMEAGQRLTHERTAKAAEALGTTWAGIIERAQGLINNTPATPE